MALQNILRSTPEKVALHNARAERALVLYRDRGHLIRSVASDTFEVPSCGMVGKRYTVRYGGKVESCSCKDYEFGGGRACKHLLCVGILHASRRSGIKVRTVPGAIAGDPFAHAGKRRECPACFGGYVSITIEEDGAERVEALPCRRCVGEEDLS